MSFSLSVSAQNRDDDEDTGIILSAPLDRPASIIPGPYIAPGSVRSDLFGNEPLDPDVEDRNNNNNSEVFFDSDGFAIESDELDILDPASIGLSDASSLPFELWRGTSYEAAKAIINALPAASRSPVLNVLALKLVVAPAGVPEVEGDIDNIRPSGLLEARLGYLADSGQFSVLGQMLSNVPADYSSAELRSLRTDYALVTGDVLTACEIARDAREEAGAVCWLKVLAYCAALDGDLPNLSFHVNLLMETNDASPEFTRLLNKISAMADGDDRRRGGVSSLSRDDLTPLLVAMLANTGEEVSIDEIKETNGMMISAFARRADLPIDLRAELGAIAVQRGLMPFEAYSDVVRAMDFTTGERNSVDLLADTVEGVRVNNLLLDEAWTMTDIARQKELVDLAWSRGRASGSLASVLAPVSQLLVNAEKSVDRIVLAPMAARSAFYTGQPEQAREWYDYVLSRATVGQRQAVTTAVEMWPLMIINDMENQRPFSENILRRWRNGLTELPLEEQLDRAGLFYALLDVFGYQVPEDMWLEIATGAGNAAADAGISPRHAAWRSFLSAAQKEHFGETLGLAIMMMGDAGPAKMNVSSLTSVLAVLKRMGLEKEARALAIEAMIANGF